MGMTIDKIIKKLLWFEDYNEDTYCGGDRIQDEYGDWYYKVNEDDFEAFRQAAEIMRKYQKIEKILNSASYIENGTVYSYTYDENSRIKHIRKVVEDGNDD